VGGFIGREEKIVNLRGERSMLALRKCMCMLVDLLIRCFSFSCARWDELNDLLQLVWHLDYIYS
jgi:hypothetical protein